MNILTIIWGILGLEFLILGIVILYASIIKKEKLVSSVVAGIFLIAAFVAGGLVFWSFRMDVRILEPIEYILIIAGFSLACGVFSGVGIAEYKQEDCKTMAFISYALAVPFLISTLLIGSLFFQNYTCEVKAANGNYETISTQSEELCIIGNP